LAGGEGAHTAATASSGSRERMRGRSQGRFTNAPAAPSGVWGCEGRLGIPLLRRSVGLATCDSSFLRLRETKPARRMCQAGRRPGISQYLSLFRTFPDTARSNLHRQSSKSLRSRREIVPARVGRGLPPIWPASCTGGKSAWIKAHPPRGGAAKPGVSRPRSPGRRKALKADVVTRRSTGGSLHHGTGSRFAAFFPFQPSAIAGSPPGCVPVIF